MLPASERVCEAGRAHIRRTSAKRMASRAAIQLRIGEPRPGLPGDRALRPSSKPRQAIAASSLTALALDLFIASERVAGRRLQSLSVPASFTLALFAWYILELIMKNEGGTGNRCPSRGPHQSRPGGSLFVVAAPVPLGLGIALDTYVAAARALESATIAPRD